MVEWDMRGARTQELRYNIYGHRPFADGPNGSHDPQAHTLSNSLTSDGMGFQDFMKKWTSTNQRFGWKHRGDLTHLPRHNSVPELGKPFPQEEKKTEYEEPIAPEEDASLKQASCPPQYPNAFSWKPNRYGYPYLGTRQLGGISTWQPSHTDLLWPTKIDKRTEKARINDKRAYYWVQKK